MTEQMQAHEIVTDTEKLNRFKRVEELQAEAHDFAARCSDGHARAPEIEFLKPMMLSYSADVETPLFEWLDTREVGVGKITEHAFSQLASRLDVPASWAASDVSCPPELRADVFNWKLQHYEDDKRFLIRMRNGGPSMAYDDVVRAVLSAEFTPYDHHHLLDAIVDALDVVGGSMRFFRGHVGDELKAYLLVETVQIDTGDRDGGGLKPAVYISNSEIGGGSLRIAPAVYRSVCMNGAIFGWRQTSETFRAIHRWVTPKQMSFKVNEAIAQALQLAPEMAQRFLDTQATRLLRSRIPDLIETMSKKYGLTVAARDLWKGASQSSETLFDVINAATLTAQGRTAEEREQMEIMGGEIALAGVPSSYVTNWPF